MEKTVLLQLICVIVVGFSSVILVKAEDPYKYFTWTVTYGTASPLGVPQQVTIVTVTILGALVYLLLSMEF